MILRIDTRDSWYKAWHNVRAKKTKTIPCGATVPQQLRRKPTPQFGGVDARLIDKAKTVLLQRTYAKTMELLQTRVNRRSLQFA